MAEWKLRLRGPQGTPAELVLPSGGATTVGELAALAGKATNVAVARLVLRCGFPPRPIDHAGDKRAQSVATDGLLQNRDVLTIERKPAPESAAAPAVAGAAAAKPATKKRKARGKGFSKAAGAGHQLGQAAAAGAAAGREPAAAVAAAAAAAAPAAAAGPSKVDLYAGSPKKKRRTKMPGGGMRLGAEDEDPDDAAAAQAALDRRHGASAPGAAAAAAAAPPEEEEEEEEPEPEEPATVDEVLRAHGFSSIRGGYTLGGAGASQVNTLGSAVNRTEAAQNAAAADLVDAVSSTNQSTVSRVLRHDLKNARELREQEAEAERRIAAALGSNCAFVSLPDGSMNMSVTYKVGPRKEKTEEVQDIPRPLLKMVLEAVLGSQDAQARNNLRPLSMAQATPRVFWNVVRHGGVGPACNFQQALSVLVPDPQWAEFWRDLDVRDRKRSKRAKEAEASEQAVEEYFANDSD